MNEYNLHVDVDYMDDASAPVMLLVLVPRVRDTAPAAGAYPGACTAARASHDAEDAFGTVGKRQRSKELSSDGRSNFGAIR